MPVAINSVVKIILISSSSLFTLFEVLGDVIRGLPCQADVMLFRVNRPGGGGGEDFSTGLVQLSEMTASDQVSYTYRQHCRCSQGKFFVGIFYLLC